MLLSFTIIVISMTSAIAFATTRGKHSLNVHFVRGAVRDLFEYIGTFALFWATNVVLAAVIVIAFRGIAQHFIAIYDLDSPLLMVFSAAQGFVFQQWWRSTK